MSYETIRLDTDGPVATIRLHRPERMNAVVEAMYRELGDALARVDDDAELRCAILTGSELRRNGTVKQAFCAGADLKEHAAGRRDPDERRAYIELAHDTVRRLVGASTPVIAAVNGPARGAGAELALACDFVLMADEATLGLPETGLGTFVGGGLTWILPRLVGLARARELIVTGRVVDGGGPLISAWPCARSRSRDCRPRPASSRRRSHRRRRRRCAWPSGCFMRDRRVWKRRSTTRRRRSWRAWTPRTGPRAWPRSPSGGRRDSGGGEMSLHRVLDARSVAVVGASRDETKRGYQAVRALLTAKYEGAIYPVHPTEESILGLPCRRNVLEIDGPVDLALITTPASTLPGILEQCGRKGVAGAVVIAAGFGELGARGRRLQAEVTRIAREHGVRIVGPNTSGLINVHTGMNLVGLSDVPRGDLALVTQSGNLALHVITEARLKSQKGFSYYVGVGNEADVRFHEYLEFLGEDPKTKAILVYVEGMSEGREFLQQAHRTTRRKPIVLLQGGRSATGSRAAGSHTGVLAGISEVARSAFRRAGIVVVDHSDELFPAAEALSGLPPLRDPRIAILADGGGHATIAADVLTDHGLDIPTLTRSTQARLAEVLSANAALRNPIDVAGSTDRDPGVFAECARILLESERVGGLLLVGLFGGYGLRFSDRLGFIEEDVAHRLGKLVRETGKPIVVHSLYKFAKPHSHDLLRYYGIPVYDSVETSCLCMSVLAQYGAYLGSYRRRSNFVLSWGRDARPESRALLETAASEGRRMLLEHEGKRLLALHGAPVTDDRLAKSATEAVRLARAVDGPVALKVCSPDILHKSDAGGVRLGLRTAEEVRRAFGEIIAGARAYRPKADLRGCVVSPMSAPGTEVIVGTKIDAQFGPVLLFGVGGILVEVLKDVVFRVLPITRTAARKMVSEIRSAPLLHGFRGERPVSQKALVDLLLTVSEIVEAYPEIEEMDLNPIVARPDGATIVDARVLLRRPANNRNGAQARRGRAGSRSKKHR